MKVPAHKKPSRSALVTGGAKRIGKGIALNLAKAGYAIALHYRSSHKEALRIQNLITKKGGTCELFQCDLEDAQACALLIRNVKKKIKRIDVLINNASIFQPSSIQTDHLNQLDLNLNIHLKAPAILMGEFKRLFKKGLIINMLDAAIVRHNSPFGNYLLSKKALANLTQMAACEFAPSIRVNGIAPGFILPPENSNSFHEAARLKSIPLGKKGDIKHITRAVHYLIQNDYVTGEILFVDGGEHLTENKV